jgi:hypothetical protein
MNGLKYKMIKKLLFLCLILQSSYVFGQPICHSRILFHCRGCDGDTLDVMTEAVRVLNDLDSICSHDVT